MKRIGCKSSSGFTLLEIMVALGITALILGLIGSSLVVTLQADQRAVEHMELLQRLREAMNRISNYLGATALSRFRPEYSPFKTFDTENSRSPFDALTFTSLAYYPFKENAHQSDFMAMTLFTLEDKRKDELQNTRILMHRVGGQINDQFQVDGGLVYVLAYGVTRFQLKYLSPEGTWADEWIAGDQAGSLPCAIMITMGMKSEHVDEVVLSTVVPLVMTSNQCEFERDQILQDLGNAHKY